MTAPPAPDPQRCEGRYPVPQTSPPRDEPFEVTYRCGLQDGHEGPHRVEPIAEPMIDRVKPIPTPDPQAALIEEAQEILGHRCSDCGHSQGLCTEHRLIHGLLALVTAQRQQLNRRIVKDAEISLGLGKLATLCGHIDPDGISIEEAFRSIEAHVTAQQAALAAAQEVVNEHRMTRDLVCVQRDEAERARAASEAQRQAAEQGYEHWIKRFSMENTWRQWLMFVLTSNDKDVQSLSDAEFKLKVCGEWDAVIRERDALRQERDRFQQDYQEMREQRDLYKQSLNPCGIHTPDLWEGNGTCVLCESAQNYRELAALRARLTLTAEEQADVLAARKRLIGHAQGQALLAILDRLSGEETT